MALFRVTKSHLIAVGLLIVVSCQTIYGDPHRATQYQAIRYNSAIDSEVDMNPKELKQYFVPESWVTVLKNSGIRDSWDELIFDGQKPGMVRILIHPSDNYSSGQLEKALEKYGYPHQPSNFKIPFLLTESRSLYPYQRYPVSGPLVSPKLSATDGMGKWAGREKDTDQFGTDHGEILNKLITPHDAIYAFRISNYLLERLGGTKGEYFEFQPEQMALAVTSPGGEFKTGEIFRNIESVGKDNTRGVPGFVGYHPRGGLLLALANGKENIFDYLREVEAPIRGRALAEIYALTGLVYDSPHSQNFLPKTDALFRLTGELLVRDLSDLMPTIENRTVPGLAELFLEYKDRYAKYITSDDIVGTEKEFVFRHSFRKGNSVPIADWNEPGSAEQAVLEYFLIHLGNLGGVDVDELRKISNFDLTRDYARLTFRKDSATWSKVQEGLKRFRQDRQREGVRKTPRLSSASKGNFLANLIAKKLSGIEISPQEQSSAHSMWAVFKDKPGKSRASLAIHLVALDIIPTESYAEILRAIDNPQVRELALESLIKNGSPKDFIETFKFLRQFERLDHHRYSRFKYSLENVTMEKFSQSDQIKILEALYFSYTSNVSERYKGSSLGDIDSLFKKAKILPDSVRRDLNSWVSKFELHHMAAKFLILKEPKVVPTCQGLFNF